MMSRDVIFGVIFGFQTAVGFAGNSLLFMLQLCVLFSCPHKKKPMDAIVAHLALANALTLVFRGVPDIILSFGIRPEMGDVGCKTVLYIQRVTRRVSLWASALQSSVQVLMVTPGNARWAWLRHRLSTLLQPSLLSFWAINMVIYTNILLEAVANRNVTDVIIGYSSPSCRIRSFNQLVAASFLSTVSVRDLLFILLMTCSSACLVTVLLRHRRATRHLHSALRPSKRFPENEATRVVLVLVSCFVLFYWTNTFLTFYSNFGSRKDWQLEKFSDFISSCYPTICPFLLMKNENRFCRMNFSKTRFRMSPFSRQLNDQMNTP